MSRTYAKRLLRPVYDKYFRRFRTAAEKAKLRKSVSSLPLTRDYPFDPEAKLLSAIDLNLSPMFDIGANSGIYGSILEDIVGSKNLYMFEPLRELYDYLSKRFKNSHVFNIALSDKHERQILRVPDIDGIQYDTRASLNRHNEPNQTGYTEVEVQLTTLDAIANRLGLNALGFIKIDVEGHELQVLEGGIDTISRLKPLILIEIESRHHEHPITDIFSKLESIGYRGYYINPTSFELLSTENFNTDRDQNQQFLISRNFFEYLNNFFFVHESNVDDFVSKSTAFLESEKNVASELG